MTRYDVTNSDRTFQQIYTDFKGRGIEIDHFHCIDENGEVNHINFDYCRDENGNLVNDPDGGIAVHFNVDELKETGNSPSCFKVTLQHSDGSPDTYAITAFADECHD